MTRAGEADLVDLVVLPVRREDVEAVRFGVGNGYVSESDDPVVGQARGWRAAIGHFGDDFGVGVLTAAAGRAGLGRGEARRAVRVVGKREFPLRTVEEHAYRDGVSGLDAREGDGGVREHFVEGEVARRAARAFGEGAHLLDGLAGVAVQTHPLAVEGTIGGEGTVQAGMVYVVLMNRKWSP